MEEWSIRQAAFARCKKKLRNKLILVLAEIVLFGLLVYYSSGSHYLFAGLAGVVGAVLVVRTFSGALKKFRTGRNLLWDGVMVEAEVTEVKMRKDSGNDQEYPETVICEIIGPGGRKRKVERKANGLADMLGLVKEGVKLPVFIDWSHPEQYHIETGFLTESLFQDEQALRKQLQELKDQQGDIGKISDRILNKPCRENPGPGGSDTDVEEKQF